MNWNSLKQNRCPKCGRELEHAIGTDMIRCNGNTELKHDCDFRIRTQKMETVIADINKRNGRTYKPEHESNEEALNNM